MATKTVPVRIDSELYSAAQSTARVMSRSAAQQVQHWARIGRALEASPAVSSPEVERVLAGEQPYDNLDGQEQALVRAAWEQRIETLRDQLNLEQKFTAENRAYAELDEHGAVVVKRPGSR